MDKKITVLHIAECAGGVERYLRMLMPRLERKNFCQYFICSFNYGKADYQNIVDGVEQMDLKRTFSPFQVIRKTLGIRESIRRIRPDIVYCHSSFAGGLGRLAALGLPCKVVYNPHGWAFNMQGPALKRRVYRLAERLLARCTTKIIAISFFEKLSAVENRIAGAEKIKVIFNGIDTAAMDAGPCGAGRLRQELGIPADAYIIGMVGRISPQKAPDVFVRAAALVKRQIRNAHFIIVGDGDERDKVESLIRAEGLEGCMSITGWTGQPHRYTALFDQACLLSRWEGFGLVLAEYMALGKPVVATEVGAIPDLVVDGINGILVPKDDAGKAAGAMVRLHDDPALCREFVRAGKERVAVLYDIDRVATEHAALFVNICKRGGVKRSLGPAVPPAFRNGERRAA